MPKKRRRTKIPTPAWERPRGAIVRRLLGRGFQFYGALGVAALLVIGLGVIGYAFLADQMEEWRRPGSTAIQVEDTRYRLDYFANRLSMYVRENGGQAEDPNQRAGGLAAVSSLLVREEIVRRFAGEMDVTATDDEITEEIASRLGITADDESFDVVFRQELARTGISEADYRQMAKAAVLNRKLGEKFLSELPESADSVHYRQIEVSTEETAREMREEIEGGGDFAALAAENSLDPETKDKGGDVGWVPRGVMGAQMDELLFALEPGGIAIIPAGGSVLVIEMLEKDDAHPVEENQKTPLAASRLDDWVKEKTRSLSVVNRVDPNSGERDLDRITWAIDGARG
jgi:hypothetical protein